MPLKYLLPLKFLISVSIEMLSRKIMEMSTSTRCIFMDCSQNIIDKEHTLTPDLSVKKMLLSSDKIKLFRTWNILAQGNAPLCYSSVKMISLSKVQLMPTFGHIETEFSHNVDISVSFSHDFACDIPNYCRRPLRFDMSLSLRLRFWQYQKLIVIDIHRYIWDISPL